MASVTLATLRTRARRLSDQENSLFVSDAELTSHINASYGELYDLLVEASPDRYVSSAYITVTAPATTTALPAAHLRTLRMERLGTDGRYYRIPRRAFAENEYAERCYKIMGAYIYLYPTTDAAGIYQLWYIPSVTPLTIDSDYVDLPNGWEEFICVDAAIKCLIKEESAAEVMFARKAELKDRILRLAMRDSDEPDRVADVTSTGYTRGLWEPY